MAREIERKFLIDAERFGAPGTGRKIIQGYLSTAPDRTVRIRVSGSTATLTIKGRKVGATAPEYEYEIPLADAQEMVELLVPNAIEKTRYEVPHEGHLWEVDVFEGANAGLIVAEVELEAESDPVVLPPWLGPEVTEDPRYANA